MGPLHGWRVLAVGMRYDAMGLGVRALATAGADVAVYPLGPGSMFGEEWEIITEEDAELFEDSLPAGGGGINFVITLDGDQIIDVLADDGIDRLWAHALDELQQIDAVYLSPSYGFTALEIGHALMTRMQDAGGGQLIVSDAPSGDDQRIRWYDR